jgi:hypothetical protein
VGVSGPATAQADPRPQPLRLAVVAGVQDGPPAAELHAAWEAYEGRFGDDDGPLRAQTGVPNLNVRVNRIKAIVNTGVDFLFGPGCTIRVTDAAAQAAPGDVQHSAKSAPSATAKTAQAILDAVWGDDDQRLVTLSKLGFNGGVYGHVFVKVVPPRRGQASATNPPRLALLNPQTLRMETDPEDADLVVRYTIEYALTAPDGKTPYRKRQTITRVDPLEDDAATGDDPSGGDDDTTWQVQNWEARGLAGESWQPVGAPQVWPYALPPISDWQNYPSPNTHWGQRDVSQSLVDLNAQLRLVESNINKIGFLQGHPYLYSSGADTGGIKPTPGTILDLGAPDAKIGAVDASGDLQQLMAFAETIRADMDEESGIPGVATGRMEAMPRGQVSGITMRLLYSAILARNEHKRRLYGQGIRQVCQTALLVCGMMLEEVKALAFELGWQDPLPTDDLAGAQTAVALQSIGYSQHTLIERTGGDPDVESQYRAEEQQSQMGAIMRGQAMPPAPGVPTSPAAPDAPPQAADDADAPSQQGGVGVNPQHPAAVAARAKMKAAFGKPVNS